ncbi:hypothetical protein H8356DRAFT_1346664 [Neocallimastix lanati (nom. inval.)]|nr:hypothetical protein H8356DRAFT_1346664 [Neocallimastix sp. JGI-2020a]
MGYAFTFCFIGFKNFKKKDQQPFELSTTLPTPYLIEKFMDHYIWVINACNNINKNNKYWKTKREKETSFNKQNEIKISDIVKIRNFSRYKLDPYFVEPYQVVKKKFNTVQFMDPNTHTCLERPVHLKNIIKFNTTMTLSLEVWKHINIKNYVFKMNVSYNNFILIRVKYCNCIVVKLFLMVQCNKGQTSFNIFDSFRNPIKFSYKMNILYEIYPSSDSSILISNSKDCKSFPSLRNSKLQNLVTPFFVIKYHPILDFVYLILLIGIKYLNVFDYLSIPFFNFFIGRRMITYKSIMECPGHLGRISLNSRFRIIPASFSFHKKNVVNSSDIERRSNKKQKRITYSEYEFLLAIKNLIIDENMQKRVFKSMCLAKQQNLCFRSFVIIQVVVSFQFNRSLQAFPSNTLVGIYNMRRHNDFDFDLQKGEFSLNEYFFIIHESLVDIPDVVFEISFTLLLPLSLNLSFENTILVQKEFYSVLLMAIIKLDCLTPYVIMAFEIIKKLKNKDISGSLSNYMYDPFDNMLVYEIFFPVISKIKKQIVSVQKVYNKKDSNFVTLYLK